jgi:hypothetical protein
VAEERLRIAVEAAVADEQTRAAGLDRLDELIGAVRAACAPVTLSIDGDRRAVYSDGSTTGRVASRAR